MSPWVSFLLIAYVTVAIVLYWLFVHRPITRKTSEGQTVRVSGVRLGGRGYTEGSVRATGILFALVSLGLSIVVYAIGTLWWFGVAAYGAIWLTVIYLDDLRVISPRFHPPMKLLALAFIPMAIALSLGWAKYNHWFSLPVTEFHIINGIATAMFIYVAIRPMR